MIRYPADYNPIREYWQKIQSGEEAVGKKIRKTYRKLVWDLDHPGEYFYSPKRANHVLEFAENFCHHSKGKLGGRRVQLELWEKAHLAAIFGFVDIEGVRKYRESVLIVGKKNGKSLLASIVGNYMLTADGEPGPEVYAVATKKDQSKIIWGESKRMIRKSPALRKRVRSLVAELDCDFNDGVFKPLASDSDTLDGLNIHCCLMDEIHQWKNGRALYDIMADGTTAREQPLLYITSTAGKIREDIYDDKYAEAERVINGYFDPDGYHDEHFIAFIYELDDRSEWTDPACWKKANPGLGTIKSREQLAAKVEKAKVNPQLVKNLLCKEFNIRETATGAWLPFEVVDNPATFTMEDITDTYAIGGCDLSATTDLTCATLLIMKAGSQIKYILQMYFLPEELLEQRAREDKIPYDIWRDRGLLTACPGSRVDYSMVTAWFNGMRDKYQISPLWVYYDRALAGYWVEDMKGSGFTMVPCAQGAMTFSNPMKTLEADLRDKLVNYNNNPVLKWCLCNTSAQYDTNDNVRPVKGRSRTQRIDGMVSLLDAYVGLYEKAQDYSAMI